MAYPPTSENCARLAITWRAGWVVIDRDSADAIVYRGATSDACMAWIYRDHPTIGPMFARKAEEQAP